MKAVLYLKEAIASKGTKHLQMEITFSIQEGCFPCSASQESTMVFRQEVSLTIEILRVAQACVPLGLSRQESFAIAQNAFLA